MNYDPQYAGYPGETAAGQMQYGEQQMRAAQVSASQLGASQLGASQPGVSHGGGDVDYHQELTDGMRICEQAYVTRVARRIFRRHLETVSVSHPSHTTSAP